MLRLAALLGAAAAAACVPGAAGAAGAPAAAASVRSDSWYAKLPEGGCKDPTTGRRVHAVVDGVPAGAGGAVSSVTVNGQEGLNLADITYFHWLRVHGNGNTSSLWVSFHTDNTDWLGGAVDLEVKGASGRSLFSGKIPLVSTGGALTLSYLAFRKGGTEAVMHIHNNNQQKALALSSATLNGVPVALPPSAAKPVPPQGHLVVAVPVKSGGPVRANDVWTVRLGNGLGFGGRVSGLERFAVEVWPHSEDCSLPGANDDNAKELSKIGVDSVYYHAGSFQKNCGVDLPSVVNALPSTFHVVTDADTAKVVTPRARAAAIDAILLGDEVDGKVDADHLLDVIGRAQDSQSKAPTVPTYMGSKTTRNVGAFAGIADIQGSDAYAGACAPTMAPVVLPLPLQYPYYYLRNARDNHAPGVFWGYSQLYSDAWSYQANANEIIAQIAQVVLSGSKALMFFQAYHDQFQKHKISDIGDAIQAIRAVGDIVREGDVGGMTFSTSATLNKDVMIEVIRSPEHVLVAIVNTNAKGYSNLLCHTQLFDRHWTFSKLDVDSITLHTASAPDVGKLSNWREATAGGLSPLSDVDVSSSGSDVVLGKVSLDDAFPMRLLVADVQ